MLKKMMALAIVLGLVAAAALPGAASAKWMHHENGELKSDVDFELEGSLGFQSELGQLACQVEMTMTFFALQGTGQIDSIDHIPQEEPTFDCGTSGSLAFCQIHAMKPKGLHWLLHTTGTKENPTVSITFGGMHFEQTGGFCPFKHATITEGNLNFLPTDAGGKVNEGKTVGTFDLSGSTQGHYYSSTPAPASQTTATVQFKGIQKIVSLFEIYEYNI